MISVENRPELIAPKRWGRYEWISSNPEPNAPPYYDTQTFVLYDILDLFSAEQALRAAEQLEDPEALNTAQDNWILTQNNITLRADKHDIYAAYHDVLLAGMPPVSSMTDEGLNQAIIGASTILEQNAAGA